MMGRKEYGRLGLGPNCSDADTLTLIPALSSIKCIDIGAGSRESFAVTESGNEVIRVALTVLQNNRSRIKFFFFNY